MFAPSVDDELHRLGHGSRGGPDRLHRERRRGRRGGRGLRRCAGLAGGGLPAEEIQNQTAHVQYRRHLVPAAHHAIEHHRSAGAAV
jgi:hypothetical protein